MYLHDSLPLEVVYNRYEQQARVGVVVERQQPRIVLDVRQRLRFDGFRTSNTEDAKQRRVRPCHPRKRFLPVSLI